VAGQLIATAAPARGGRDSQEYGAGLVDPYRAVTETRPLGDPGALPGVVLPPPDPETTRDAAWWGRATGLAKAGLGVAAVAVLVAAVLAWAVPRGRRRHWAPGRATPPPATAEPGDPPEEIFLFPQPPVEAPRN
jgi:membrane-anchored mycosin MYCP